MSYGKERVFRADPGELGRQRKSCGEADQGRLQGLCAQTSDLPRRRAGVDTMGASESLRMTECRIPTSE